MFICVDFQQLHLLHRCVAIIDNVINIKRYHKDIFPVQRGDECVMQFIDQDASDFICFDLFRPHLVDSFIF
jgi:hypothetical protein